jgi:uncharacterized protein YecA (UPF0149 family)
MPIEDAKLLNDAAGRKLAIEMKLHPTTAQKARHPPRVSGNDYCPCGSGLKFKKCHLNPNA